MTGFEILIMIISPLILVGFIGWHVIKTHGKGLQPVDPMYLGVMLANWTLLPIAFSFTFFLTPYTLLEGNPLSFYCFLPFPKEYHSFAILILAVILGLIGFFLCFHLALKLYVKCYIRRGGLLYWLSSWLCFGVLGLIIFLDFSIAYQGDSNGFIATILVLLVPVAFLLVALPLYNVDYEVNVDG